MSKKISLIIGGIVSFFFVAAVPAFAGVTVYAEGAYTESDLVLYLYSDITDTPVVSYGIKVSYDTAQLTAPVVEKNQEVWYFGSQAAPLPTPKAEPDLSTPGEIVIVGGKIDESAPQEGVIGDRKLMARITFNRTDTSIPFTPTLGLALGKDGSYANFVEVDGALLDGSVTFATEVHQRGDANGDGMITNLDMGTVKKIILGIVPGGYRCFADANADDMVTNLDMGKIKKIILGIE